jgi:hypothetical protein
MWLLRGMLFRWLWDRFSRRQAQQRGRWGRQQETRSRGQQAKNWRRQPPTSRRGAPQQPRRGRGGVWGPFPYYSRRTRGGSRMTVSGCCLPLALGLLSFPAVALRLVLKR